MRRGEKKFFSRIYNGVANLFPFHYITLTVWYYSISRVIGNFLQYNTIIGIDLVRWLNDQIVNTKHPVTDFFICTIERESIQRHLKQKMQFFQRFSFTFDISIDNYNNNFFTNPLAKNNSFFANKADPFQDLTFEPSTSIFQHQISHDS